MSAVSPSSGDREIDSMRRAQRAHEPSMEDILASIRSMMVEEREADKTTPIRPVSPRSASPAPQIVYLKDDAAPQRAEQEPVPPDVKASPALKPPPAFNPLEEMKLSQEQKLVAEAKPSPETSPSLQASRPKPEQVDPEPSDLPSPLDEGPLLSTETGQAVTSAFEALSANLAARGLEIAQGMAREMLRPMLKAWLDENLPGIVERLVRAEIERVARGIR